MTIDQMSESDKRQRVRTIRLAVTEDLVQAALPADSGHCMIADAVKAAVPNAKAVSVDLATIRWTDPRMGRRYIYFTPPSVQRALLLFDNAVLPKPFTFVLRAPAQIVRSGEERSKRGGRVTQGMAEVIGDSEGRQTKIGGSTPGLGALSSQPNRVKNLPSEENRIMRGNRRQYGMRSMGRPKERWGEPQDVSHLQ